MSANPSGAPTVSPASQYFDEQLRNFGADQAFEIGKLDVEQNEVGVKASCRLHCADPVLGLADDLVSLGLEQRSRARPEARVVVDDEDCHAHSLVPRSGSPNTVFHTLFGRPL